MSVSDDEFECPGRVYFTKISDKSVMKIAFAPVLSQLDEDVSEQPGAPEWVSDGSGRCNGEKDGSERKFNRKTVMQERCDNAVP